MFDREKIYRLLITFANSLYPGETQQNVMKEFSEKVNFEKKNQQMTKYHEKFPSIQRVNVRFNMEIEVLKECFDSAVNGLCRAF